MSSESSGTAGGGLYGNIVEIRGRVQQRLESGDVGGHLDEDRNVKVVYIACVGWQGLADGLRYRRRTRTSGSTSRLSALTSEGKLGNSGERPSRAQKRYLMIPLGRLST